MANKNWYVLKVRSGFVRVVAQKLRRLNLETIVLDPKFARPRKNNPRSLTSVDCVYCRFAAKNRPDLLGIPGVVDVVGTPSPIDADRD